MTSSYQPSKNKSPHFVQTPWFELLGSVIPRKFDTSRDDLRVRIRWLDRSSPDSWSTTQAAAFEALFDHLSEANLGLDGLRGVLKRAKRARARSHSKAEEHLRCEALHLSHCQMTRFVEGIQAALTLLAESEDQYGVWMSDVRLARYPLSEVEFFGRVIGCDEWESPDFPITQPPLTRFESLRKLNDYWFEKYGINAVMKMGYSLFTSKDREDFDDALEIYVEDRGVPSDLCFEAVVDSIMEECA